MVKNISSILKEVLVKVKPEENEIKEIGDKLRKFLVELEKNRKKEKLNAEIFVGGSFAKGTIIKKGHYDIDIFVRFDKKYSKQSLSELMEKIIGKTKKERIHGSRDYFRVKAEENLFFEVVPVVKIKNPKEAENVTDLSYFHVNYVKRKVKAKELDEIRIAKAFCHANGFYGAESYIKGFSGYGLELLIRHYGSFLNLVKDSVKIKDKKVIDTEKLYKSKSQILMDVNSAKLQSPIVLIDPTFRQRNVLAALSEETFRKFQETAKKFIKNPSTNFFEPKKMNFSKLKDEAKRKGYEFILTEIETDKQEGDIAGSKLLKFYNHLNGEIKRYFEIKDSGFYYEKKKSAKLFFVVKKKGDFLVSGPSVNDTENVKKFKAKHRKTFVKNKRIYAKEKVNLSIRDFIVRWKAENVDRIKEMYIVSFMVLEI